jgi:opine dehydrogenase
VTSGTIVVLGADAAGLALAASLARAGREVVLWDGPPSSGSIARRCAGSSVRVIENGAEEVVKLATVTTDLFAALAVTDTFVACTPPIGQATFASFVLPLIEPRHTLILPAGNLAALAYAKWLRDRGRCSLPTLVETDWAPFVAVREEPDAVRIVAAPAELSVGVFPSERTAAAFACVQSLLPGSRAAPHLPAAALAGVVPFLRAPTLLLNAGAIERAPDAFALFEDGFTPGVAGVAQKVDDERLSLGSALGLDLPAAAAALHALGLGPLGDLWEAVNGSRLLTTVTTCSRVPDADMDPADEAAFVLQPWVEIAGLLGVDAPVAGGLLACATAASGEAGDGTRAPGRSLKDLGLAGMSRETLTRYLETGSDAPPG